MNLIELKAVYSQEADTCSSEEQYITITTETNGSCHTPYLNIKIGDPETGQGHWSINEPSDLVAIVEDFVARVGECEVDKVCDGEEE